MGIEERGTLFIYLFTYSTNQESQNNKTTLLLEAHLYLKSRLARKDQSR